MEQILGIVGLVLLGAWVIAMLVIQIWYLVASFRANVGLTLLSLLIPPVGLYVLIRYWAELKKPFLNNLVVGVGGTAVIIVCAIAFNLSLPVSMPGTQVAEEVPEEEAPPVSAIKPATGGAPLVDLPTVVPATVPVETPTKPATETPEPPVKPQASWGFEAPVSDKALVTIPQGWQDLSWDLPDLEVAMGDAGRGEFVTIHAVEKDAGQAFDAFQQAVLQQVREKMIEAGEAGALHEQIVDECLVVSRSLAGRSLLPDQQGRPMAARLSCIEGEQQNYYIVQWRSRNWDATSQRNFDRLIKSFVELDSAEADL